MITPATASLTDKHTLLMQHLCAYVCFMNAGELWGRLCGTMLHSDWPIRDQSDAYP